jgi:trk system potassium uptake protein TrkH
MNHRILFQLLGTIARVISAALLLSFCVCAVSGEWQGRTGRGLLLSALVALGIGASFAWLGRNAGNRIFRKEALCVIGLGWLLASWLGALPYWFILEDCRFADAWFESVSGFTTTGATVFADYQNRMSKGLLFWRSMTQWVGGLGVVVLFVALVANLGSGAKVLFSNESSGQSADVEDASIRSGARHILYFYLGLTLLATLAYAFCGLSWFDACCHAATTVSTGGFSTINAGVPGYANSALEWWMVFFMFMGGFSFLLALRFLRSGWRAWRSGLEGIVYGGVFFGATLLVAAVNAATLGFGSSEKLFREAAFQVITIMTTTGYATADFNLWASPAKWLLLGLMVLGGCSSSTAGGIKVIRAIAALRMIIESIERSFRSHVVRTIRLNGRVLEPQDREAILTFLVLTGAVLAVGILGFSLMQPSCDLETGLSAVFACLFNIGPGLGQVGPMAHFGFLQDVTKFWLSLLMLLGRLEFYALLVLFSPMLWQKFR